MEIATQVAPISGIGVLIDFVLPPPSARNVRDDFLDATRLTSSTTPPPAAASTGPWSW